MKARELAKLLNKICDDIKFDPEVVMVDERNRKNRIKYKGTEVESTWDYPEQTSPLTKQKATIWYTTVDCPEEGTIREFALTALMWDNSSMVNKNTDLSV